MIVDCSSMKYFCNSSVLVLLNLFSDFVRMLFQCNYSYMLQLFLAPLLVIFNVPHSLLHFFLAEINQFMNSQIFTG